MNIDNYKDEMRACIRKALGENEFKVNSDLKKEKKAELMRQRDELNKQITELESTAADERQAYIEKALESHGLPTTASNFIEGNTQKEIDRNIERFTKAVANKSQTATYIPTGNTSINDSIKEAERRASYGNMADNLFETWC